MTELALVAVLVACGTPAAPPATQGGSDVNSKDGCLDALRMIRTRDFRAWQGLPADCTPERLAKDLPRATPNEGQRQLGTAPVDVTWWPAQLDGYREPLEVQIAKGRVVRIDGERPELTGGLEAHLGALGEPAGKLSYYADTVKLPDGEWVWPARGIAIYLNADHRFVNRVALFHATDLPAYVRDLQPNLRVYEER